MQSPASAGLFSALPLAHLRRRTPWPHPPRREQQPSPFSALPLAHLRRRTPWPHPPQREQQPSPLPPLNSVTPQSTGCPIFVSSPSSNLRVAGSQRPLHNISRHRLSEIALKQGAWRFSCQAPCPFSDARGASAIHFLRTPCLLQPQRLLSPCKHGKASSCLKVIRVCSSSFCFPREATSSKSAGSGTIGLCESSIYG